MGTWGKAAAVAKRVFVGEQRVASIDGPIIPPRGGFKRGSVAVNDETALRHSAVWACLRLRADMVSTMPVDIYRDVKVDGETIAVELSKPPVFKAPGGEDWAWEDWTYASQNDLDSCGNTVGLITETNGAGLPARIDLQHKSCVTIFQRKNDDRPRYRINGKEYSRDKVYHERAFPMSGLPFGMSPLMYAAWTIGEYLSAQEFGLDWFAGAGIPKARLKNTEREVKPREAAEVKERYNASIATGDLFVHGSNWEYNMMQAEMLGSEWLESRRFGLADVCRFLGAPTDLIEAAISSPGTVTYQGATQRNLQFLVLNLGPAMRRRESAWSRFLLPAPRYAKLNEKALLRMDPKTQGDFLNAAIAARRLAPSEARALENRAPYTAAQMQEFTDLFGPVKGTTPTASAPPDRALNFLIELVRSQLDGAVPVSPAPGLWDASWDVPELPAGQE